MTDENQAAPLAIVIPVRNAAHLLRECLASLSQQTRTGDSLIVVDDSSNDATSAVAERLGAHVIRRNAPGGPYAARNDGWRAASQPYVLFTDVRCIARPGLLDRVRAAASQNPGLIFVDIVVRSGNTLAERVAAGRQHLRLEYYRSDSFLRFFPTAGLAVERVALEAVDGFRVLESGGDADLCWRIQLAGFRGLNEVEEPLIEWRPRSDVLSLVQQWAKYGRSNAQLRHAYGSQGAVVPPPQSTVRLSAIHLRRTLRALRRTRFRAVPVTVVDGLVDLAQDVSYGRTLRDLRRHIDPLEP